MESNFSGFPQQRNRADVAVQMFPQGVENLPSCVNASLGWGPPGVGVWGATSGLIESFAFVVPSWTGWVQDLGPDVPVLRSQRANTGERAIRWRKRPQEAVGRVMKTDGRDEAALREGGGGVGGQAGPAQRQPLVKPL